MEVSSQFISPIISIVSLSFSIYVYYKNKKFEKSQRKYNIISPIYTDILIKDIPYKFSQLNFKNKNDKSIDEFVSSIQNLRSSIKVIKIMDKKTYKVWNDILMEIEDFVVNKGNYSAPDSEHQDKILDELSERLNKVYREILSEDYKDILN